VSVFVHFGDALYFHFSKNDSWIPGINVLTDTWLTPVAPKQQLI
jgi:hypothetical protein